MRHRLNTHSPHLIRRDVFGERRHRRRCRRRRCLLPRSRGKEQRGRGRKGESEIRPRRLISFTLTRQRDCTRHTAELTAPISHLGLR